ncbi:MAG: F0F1 ATP synthase subunit B [Solobacterium sp.]|nr:F0F1 ATP synthase subunit B [Erysipelotrichaceae bacterium]MCI6700550.1 F0F1 ATP synthase subunit B [Solobacterium sp.]MCI7731938.1 F0F1 ATP synthase subunit B [Solobacterium sp.]MDD5842139.1 F0F1 ATP synthase subunit B [Solobacterium sp.]MDD5983099.1 F0F1 ATP synthase subunit B [Solobacterium sp.]
MVNFDVQGSLMPNLYTMIVQLCATLIIFLCIKKWLWKPVKNILAKRADAMQASLDSAFEQNEEARVNLEASRKELNDAKESSREIIDAARQEAVNLKNEIVSDAKRQAQAKLDQADEKIARAKADAQSDLHDEMVSVAMAAVSKLLDEKATSKDDEEAIDKYIKEVKKSS